MKPKMVAATRVIPMSIRRIVPVSILCVLHITTTGLKYA